MTNSKRFYLGLLLLLGCLLYAVWGEVYLRVGAAAELPSLPPLTAHDRVLILAPHCDDETVACGGLIQHARAVGAAVHVVLMTNGDGYYVAAKTAFKKTSLTARDYLHLGEQRQQESLAALSVLGVNTRQVTFLGYPDGGLLPMWTQEWEATPRYTSPYTEKDNSPYPNSYRQHAPYYGRAVLNDLEQIIRDFHPTLIALPHPEDRHPDHWTAYAYGQAALYELGLQARMRQLVYLLRKTGWPAPKKKDEPYLLQPPEGEPNWKVLFLSTAEETRKRTALQCHRTQLAVMRNFLMQFVGPRELYTFLTPVLLPRATSPITIDVSPREWNHTASVLLAPTDATAHFTSLKVSLAPHTLDILLELTAPKSPQNTYTLYLHPLLAGQVEAPQGYRLDSEHPPAQTQVISNGAFIEARVPWEAQASGALLAVEMQGPKQVTEHTPWVTLITLPPGGTMVKATSKKVVSLPSSVW